MANIIPHDLFRSLAEKEQDLNATDTIKVCLVKSGYTPDADHTQYSDVSGQELANSNGYTTGGATVTASVTDSDANNNVKIDISDPSWTASGGTLGGAAARYGVVYNDSAAVKSILQIIDFAADQTITDGQVFTIRIDANGLFTIAQA
jgi:hypothetical protein